jgi:hypothetical protein
MIETHRLLIRRERAGRPVKAKRVAKVGGETDFVKPSSEWPNTVAHTRDLVAPDQEKPVLKTRGAVHRPDAVRK